jgi:hypothetical protein
VQTANCEPVVTYDFRDGRYFANRLTAEDKPAEFNLRGMSEQEFVPDSVRSRYSGR